MRSGWLLAVLAGCGRLAFDPLADAGGSGGGDGSVDTAPPCTVGPWSSAQRLVNLETTSNDWAPALSDDGLTLVWDSPITSSDDLYVAVRTSTAAAFGAPTALANLNSPVKEEYGAAWLGQSLYYTEFDPMAMVVTQMVATYQGDGMFGTPSPAAQALPTGNAWAFSTTGLEGFYTINPVTGMYYLRHMMRPSLGSDWVTDTLVDSLTPVNTVTGWPSFDDGRQTLYYERTVGTAMSELVETTRPDATSAFGAVVPINTGGTGDGDPEISRDGLTLVFASTRAGGAGMNDLYMMTRACQ